MMERETELALLEAKEALERSLDRLTQDMPGSARVHINHALYLLASILDKGR
jgi:hypothetical protein